MRHWWPALWLLPVMALAQSVPNPGSPIVQGEQWTPPQWITAWQSKADYPINAATLSGGTVPCPQMPSFTGAFTTSGCVISGVLSVINGGTGTPTPSLVPGSGIQVTGT